MVSTGLVPVLVCLCVFWSLSEAQERLDLYDGDICKQAGGKTWTCKPVRSCPKAIQDLRKNKRPQQCRFSSSQPVVCCEPLDSPKPPPSPKPPSLPSPKPPRFPSSSKPGSKSKQKCKEYAEYVYVKTQGFFGNEVKYDTCAIVEPLITKGKDAQSREYPHMALIGYGKRNAIEWLCGGSLISKRFVLSAGHCTDSGSKGLARWVRLGEYDVSTKSDEKQGLAQSEEYEIIERINHPYYQGPSVYNDIALYRLSREVEFNEYIRPICLHTEDQSYKDFAIATGWGRIEWGGKGSDVLQKVNLTITEADKCIEAFKLAKCPKLCNGIEESSQFCAGDLMNGGDTCQGDSGGPLQVRLTTPYCMYSQIGITSFGVKCGGNKPGVYTRVSKYISWIESIVWP